MLCSVGKPCILNSTINLSNILHITFKCDLSSQPLAFPHFRICCVYYESLSTKSINQVSSYSALISSKFRKQWIHITAIRRDLYFELRCVNIFENWLKFFINLSASLIAETLKNIVLNSDMCNLLGLL